MQWGQNANIVSIIVSEECLSLFFWTRKCQDSHVHWNFAVVRSLSIALTNGRESFISNWESSSGTWAIIIQSFQYHNSLKSMWMFCLKVNLLRLRESVTFCNHWGFEIVIYGARSDISTHFYVRMSEAMGILSFSMRIWSHECQNSFHTYDQINIIDHIHLMLMAK